MHIKQYVFTNFGVGIKDETWLTYRIELLINVTAQSIFAQIYQDFTWCIFIDEDLPYIYKARLLKMAAKSDITKLVIYPVQEYSEISSRVVSLLSDCGVDEPILTTRIDDDDALNKNSIGDIQKKALTALSTNVEVALIALTRGYEWLPTDQVFRKVNYESLALGLTLLSRRNLSVISITQLAHHTAMDTLKKFYPNALYLPIEIDAGGYLYTKHPLSDSYYIGSRARILQDEEVIDINQINLEIFGLNIEILNYLQQVFIEAPFGMPHKYMAKLGALRKELKTIKTVESDCKGEDSYESSIIAKIEWYQKNATRRNPSLNGKKVRLAIIGSCVSRDLFTLRPDLLTKFEIVAYLARQSVISYTSVPCHDVSIRDRIGADGFEDRRAQWDMDKSHWSILEAARPDLILVDFIDERIGLIFHKGSIITPSGPIVKAFERSSTSFKVIRPWDNSVKKLREWAVREFFVRCYSICNNIIVHEANWAKEYIDENNEIKSFSDTKYQTLVNLNSTILDEVFRLTSLTDIPTELIGGGDIMKAGGNHLWSFCPYHYNDMYYRQLSKDLVRRI